MHGRSRCTHHTRTSTHAAVRGIPGPMRAASVTVSGEILQRGMRHSFPRWGSRCGRYHEPVIEYFTPDVFRAEKSQRRKRRLRGNRRNSQRADAAAMLSGRGTCARMRICAPPRAGRGMRDCAGEYHDGPVGHIDARAASAHAGRSRWCKRGGHQSAACEIRASLAAHRCGDVDALRRQRAAALWCTQVSHNAACQPAPDESSMDTQGDDTRITALWRHRKSDTTRNPTVVLALFVIAVAEFDGGSKTRSTYGEQN
ncbi:hypothetical protein FB451DRAFT_1168443 [Mycena latifolia]|nr:hypothetical protein FB451DRAFT_1168443 [Mycena latifolia]